MYTLYMRIIRIPKNMAKALYKMHHVIRYLYLLPATHADIMK